MTIRGKLRRGRRRLICRLIGHDWGEWDGYSPVNGWCDRWRYRECKRCPKVEWNAIRWARGGGR